MVFIGFVTSFGHIYLLKFAYFNCCQCVWQTATEFQVLCKIMCFLLFMIFYSHIRYRNDNILKIMFGTRFICHKSNVIWIHLLWANVYSLLFFKSTGFEVDIHFGVSNILCRVHGENVNNFIWIVSYIYSYITLWIGYKKYIFSCILDIHTCINTRLMYAEKYTNEV